MERTHLYTVDTPHITTHTHTNARGTIASTPLNVPPFVVVHEYMAHQIACSHTTLAASSRSQPLAAPVSTPHYGLIAFIMDIAANAAIAPTAIPVRSAAALIAVVFTAVLAAVIV